MSFRIYLPDERWEYVNQFQQVDPTTGKPSIDAIKLCGECCASQVLFYKSGFWIPPDRIRTEVYNSQYMDIMYNYDMVNYLNATTPAGKYFTNKTNYHAITLPRPQFTTPVNAQGSVLYDCWDYLSVGNPCIVLQYYDYPGNSLLHWITVNGMEEKTTGEKLVYYADSVYGTQRTQTYQQFQDMSYQLLIGVGLPKYPLTYGTSNFGGVLLEQKAIIAQANIALKAEYGGQPTGAS